MDKLKTSMFRHDLRILESFANDVCLGIKTFEVRENDRGFQKGDEVHFQCIDKMGMKLNHPINSKIYEITYVINGWGLKNGFVAFAIREVN